jgi:hypothetical protein
VNGPTVISEVIDGEAVIMNLATGQYFSCQDVAGEIWSLIEAGTTRSGIHRHLLSRYSVGSETLAAATKEFFSALEEHDLIRAEPGDARAGEEAAGMGDSEPRAPFQKPVLNAYSDMEDLLLLDPIHDVDDTGWPMPKPAGAAGG